MGNRVESLDVLRGLAIAAMILVNSPGSWGTRFSFLKHAQWNGIMPIDFIFPVFLFVVGAVIPYSLAKYQKRDAYVKIIKRTAILFALGLFLNLFPAFDFSTLRIMGILQRIALCYFFSSLIFLHFRQKGRILFFLILTVGYGLLLTFSGYQLMPENNLVSAIDQMLLPNHLYTSSFDPEGLFSTIPAIATTLGGMLIVQYLSRTAIIGVFGVIIGLLLQFWIPLNKSLWTPSFVFVTGGAACLLLAVLHWLVDIKGRLKFFEVFGMNPLIIFFLSSFVGLLLDLPVYGTTARTFVYENYFLWAGPSLGSLLFAVVYVLIWYFIARWMYVRKIFIKI